MRLNDNRSLATIVILAVVIVLIGAVLIGRRQSVTGTPAVSGGTMPSNHPPAS